MRYLNLKNSCAAACPLCGFRCKAKSESRKQGCRILATYRGQRLCRPRSAATHCKTEMIHKKIQQRGAGESGSSLLDERGFCGAERVARAPSRGAPRKKRLLQSKKGSRQGGCVNRKGGRARKDHVRQRKKMCARKRVCFHRKKAGDRVRGRRGRGWRLGVRPFSFCARRIECIKKVLERGAGEHLSLKKVLPGMDLVLTLVSSRVHIPPAFI